MFARLPLYLRLVRLDKPIGSLLLLWPTLNALWIASNGHPSPMLLVIFVIGTILMRSAGCAINDYADRDFDRHVKRTENRPLTSGKIEAWEAVALAAALSLIAFLLILPLNTLTKELSVFALFVAGTYPFTKRFFAIPQAYLGIAFGFGIPMAFAAVQDHVPMLAWIMLAANVFWSVAYDTEYAMVDRDDDIKIGIRTSALTFGRYDVFAVMLCYAATLAIYVGIGIALGLRLVVLARLGGGGGVRGLSLRADPQPRAHAVLRRVQAQQLARRRAVRGDRAALRGRAVGANCCASRWHRAAFSGTKPSPATQKSRSGLTTGTAFSTRGASSHSGDSRRPQLIAHFLRSRIRRERTAHDRILHTRRIERCQRCRRRPALRCHAFAQHARRLARLRRQLRRAGERRDRERACPAPRPCRAGAPPPASPR